MYDLRCFGLPTLKIYCVGNADSIKDLINYFEMRQNEHIILSDFIDRIIFHGAYAYLQSEHISSKIDEFIFNKLLSKHSLLISEQDYVECMSIIHTSDVAQNLNMSEQEIIEFAMGSKWWDIVH